MDMEEEKFNLKTFRDYLKELETNLQAEISQDPEYQGEIDETLAAIKRLAKEFQDKKYEQILPDIFNVFSFLGMMKDVEEDDDEFSDLDEEEISELEE